MERKSPRARLGFSSENNVERKSPHARVGFGPDPDISAEAGGPASPRAQKILSRKKTPFAGDLAHSLADFQAEALAIHRAQKEARTEERRRLSEARAQPPNHLPARPTSLPAERSGRKSGGAGRSVTIVTPSSEAKLRDEVANNDADEESSSPARASGNSHAIREEAKEDTPAEKAA